MFSQADTLVKYLIDHLSAYEASHADALAPYRREPSRFFMGDHHQTTPGGTTMELRAVTSSLNRTVENLDVLTKKLNTSLDPGAQFHAGNSIQHHNIAQALYQARLGVANASRVIVNVLPNEQVSSQFHSANSSTGIVYVGCSSSHGPIHPFCSTGSESSVSDPPPPPLPSSLPFLCSSTHGAVIPDSSSFNSEVAIPLHVSMTSPPCASSVRKKATDGRQPSPFPDAIIHPLPHSCKTPWKFVMEQWETTDPKLGCAMKDWPPEYYSTGAMRPYNAVKYSQRQMVALEYIRYVIQIKITILPVWQRTYKLIIRLGRDDNHFLAEYPEAKTGFSKLLLAIRKRHISEGMRRRRRSKNGTPSERTPSDSSSE